MSAASGESDFLDGRGADGAGLGCAAVDLVFDLEVAAHALRINVVGDGRAAEFDGSAQDGLQGGAQADEFGASEAAGLAARTDAGAKERLIGVDVANAVEQRLVQQRGLDRRLAATEERDEVVRRDREGLAAGAGVSAR